MSAKFLDSNLFVYIFDEVDTRKQSIATEIVDEALATRNALISFQVVQECLNVLTRKLGLDTESARRFANVFLSPLWHVMPSRALYARALGIQARTKYSFYDSLIVAAALEAGCKTLLSEDLQDKQKIEGLTIRNPFA